MGGTVLRNLVFVLISLGIMFGPGDLEAKGGKAQRGKQQLVNRVLVGAGWQVAAIPVINRSSYDRPSVEYAAQLWATTSAPRLSVQHESLMLCSDVKPMRNVIILCDAAPWTGPSNSGIAAFTANYTQPKKRGMRSMTTAIQATVIWLYQPRWTDKNILHYIPSHEFGHALGLDEMNCACVMTPIVSDTDVLGPEERGAINAIYS
jgi:hypothetical protein